MKKRTKVILILGVAVLFIACAVGVLRESGVETDRVRIETILSGHPEFKSLTVSRMKPGWNRIYGKVASSNDLALLRGELTRIGIRRCAIIVDFQDIK